MLIDMEQLLFTLALDDDQEKALMGLADKAQQQLEQLNKTTKAMDEELKVILHTLIKYYKSH